jgi:hypothetical protein
MPNKRTYTIESSSTKVKGGRFKSTSPSGAAKKAASKLFRKAMKKNKSLKKLTFCIRETTSGSDKNHFEYTATRVKLAKPLVRTINGVQIVNRYKINLKACKSKGKK